jgi:AraC family transcriptional regulator
VSAGLPRTGADAGAPAALDPRLSCAIRFVQDNFSRPVKVEEIARHAGLSTARLYYLFRRQIGLTPRQLLERLRVEEAARLLARTDMSVGEIGAAAGMPGAASFSRAFLRELGCSPREFRRAMRTAMPAPNRPARGGAEKR